MSSRAISPHPLICEEKRRLAEAFIEAVRVVMGLQDRELVAVATGGMGLQRFDVALERARSRRDVAKHLYLNHLREHGC